MIEECLCIVTMYLCIHLRTLNTHIKGLVLAVLESSADSFTGLSSLDSQDTSNSLASDLDLTKLRSATLRGDALNTELSEFSAELLELLSELLSGLETEFVCLNLT